jgi:hypothetical protein
MRLMSSFLPAGRRPWRSSSRALVRPVFSYLHNLITFTTDVNGDADHTYLMFSATFLKSARRLAKEYMDEDCASYILFLTYSTR